MTSASPSSAPAYRSAAIYWWGLGLALLLTGLLIFDNRHDLFGSPAYEVSDWASNSLFVREAKSGLVTHGHYSRWNFYHPGPILFYVCAFGEAVFYDWLHVVPAPYNGQTISMCLLLTTLFSFALVVFAQRLGKRCGGYAFFLPLALVFAVWHYGATIQAIPFTSTWPASPPVLVFLSFLVAAASVASGSGRELPLLVFAGGWLVQNYVAQPLFVVPMALLAYAGLLYANRAAASAGGTRFLAAGWCSSPRAHLIAAGILALFILPLFVDALHGSESNFNRILTHLRKEHQPLNKFPRALCYFLTFGSYTIFKPGEGFFGRYSAGGMLAFVALHWQVYLCWIVALVASPLLLMVARRTETAATTGAEADTASPRDPASSFLRWFGTMTFVAFALTLVWGMKQDGLMYYFNAYFNYSIYFCVALGFAAALAVFLQALTAAPYQSLARKTVATALVLGTVVAVFGNADAFVNKGLGLSGNASLVQATNAAAADTLRPGQTCYLDVDPWSNWPVGVGVALQLDRAGYKVRVNDNWRIMFGDRHTFLHDPVDFSQPVVRWVVRETTQKATTSRQWLLLPSYRLDVESMVDLNPDGGKIRFAADGNWEQYAFAGWARSEGDWTWADQQTGLIQFRPLPLPASNTAGLEMVVDGWSFALPSAPIAQHFEVAFNGTPLSGGMFPPTPDGAPVKVHIPADLWRAACTQGFAMFVFRFPDARSPYSLGVNDDVRSLGGAFRSVQFQLVP